MIPGNVPTRKTARRARGRAYQSRRAVKKHHVPSHVVSQWTAMKVALLCCGGTVLAILMIGPMLLLDDGSSSSRTGPSHVGPGGSLLHDSYHIRSKWKDLVQKGKGLIKKEKDLLMKEEHWLEEELQIGLPAVFARQPPKETLPPQQDDTLGRGVAGLRLDQTPALLGASRGHIECDINVDYLAYWNYPQGLRDRQFDTPFRVSHDEHFMTFEPDPGGWNNIRMSMEAIVVFAAASGRTLVLPPKAPFYLLGHGKEGARTFGSFFDLSRMHPSLKIISMEDFYKSQGQTLLGLDGAELHHLLSSGSTTLCTYAGDPESNPEHCDHVNIPLREAGWQPDMESSKDCLVFDHRVFEHDSADHLPEDVMEHAKRFCGNERRLHFYNSTWSAPRLLHWNAAEMAHRILDHFYVFTLFTDPVVDNFYKRFVRDYLHYKDEIYCAAGKVLDALKKDVGQTGMFSTMHIRRGDFQYKVVKLPAEELYENTKEIWKQNEVLYIATDEKNTSSFEPIARHHELKFLNDYWSVAKLGKLDKSYIGMIDIIVASQGRTFTGTWFSTFSGYINRLRGYYGYSMRDSWYSWLDRKTIVQNWTYPHGNYPAREWPIAWTGIDGDEWVERELQNFPSPNAKYIGLESKPILQENKAKAKTYPTVTTADGRVIAELQVSDLANDTGFWQKPMARGVAGLPMTETPALEGGSRARIECDFNVDSLAYWNHPQGERDQSFESPFHNGPGKYITFAPDRGGWNNVRMSMEIIFVIAAATGRTLVLPPEINFYRLFADSKKKHRGFADFFPLYTEEFQKKVRIITMKEFLDKEGGPNGRVPIPDDIRENVMNAAEYCENRAKSNKACQTLFGFLNDAGFIPDFRAQDYCIIFDNSAFETGVLAPEHRDVVNDFCGERKVTLWDKKLSEPVLLHVRAGDKQYRLLTHFYAMIRFTDPAIDNHFKRFVRDFLHYHDSIYCAAGKIVKAVQAEALSLGAEGLDDDGGGSFGAMHIRRGDFQYKKVKIPAEEWLANTKEVWKPDEIIYIATDERNKTFFRPIAEEHPIRFLDDYWKVAGLGDLDPNYMGMIDTIVASRARAFAGTWFSTFSGYINRMRGYHGLSMMDSWYSFLDRKAAVHNWTDQTYGLYAYEWPEGWVGIDGDVRPSKRIF